VPRLWSHEGWTWKQQHRPHPHHWRLVADGHCFGIGLGGPFALLAEDALSGISHYEAQAYANWVAARGGKLEGAVVQHEYQWEVAARSRVISDYGRVWEWCGNPFHRYDGYLEPAQPEEATQEFDAGHFSLRGGSLHSQRIQRRSSLHSQRIQRRSSYRHHAAPHQRFRFSGVRLVFPASRMPWHK
jgi:iron(II)-dependent oxidoreductase